LILGGKKKRKEETRGEEHGKGSQQKKIHSTEIAQVTFDEEKEKEKKWKKKERKKGEAVEIFLASALWADFRLGLRAGGKKRKEGKETA